MEEPAEPRDGRANGFLIHGDPTDVGRRQYLAPSSVIGCGSAVYSSEPESPAKPAFSGAFRRRVSGRGTSTRKIGILRRQEKGDMTEFGIWVVGRVPYLRVAMHAEVRSGVGLKRPGSGRFGHVGRSGPRFRTDQRSPERPAQDRFFASRNGSGPHATKSHPRTACAESGSAGQDSSAAPAT